MDPWFAGRDHFISSAACGRRSRAACSRRSNEPDACERLVVAVSEETRARAARSRPTTLCCCARACPRRSPRRSTVDAAARSRVVRRQSLEGTTHGPAVHSPHGERHGAPLRRAHPRAVAGRERRCRRVARGAAVRALPRRSAVAVAAQSTRTRRPQRLQSGRRAVPRAAADALAVPPARPVASRRRTHRVDAGLRGDRADMGEARGIRTMLEGQLRTRFGAVPLHLQERIAAAEPEALQRWGRAC